MTSKNSNDRRGKNPEDFASQHASLTRRYFFQLGTAGLAALGAPKIWAKQVGDEVLSNPVLAAAVSQLEYLTPAAKFKVQRRGKPSPSRTSAGSSMTATTTTTPNRCSKAPCRSAGSWRKPRASCRSFFVTS